jgi:beta-phosphoglucomutase-like phosphatase (HAD superfamily)
MFKQSKPHPEIYEHTVEMLGTTAGHCVAVEDSTYGIQSAVAAGLRVIAVRDERFGYDQTPADRLIDDLRELPPLLGLKHNQGHW